MTTFLKEVIVDLHKKSLDFSSLTFVIPSKRAGVFLKKELSSLLDIPIFSPSILSVQSFIEEIALLKPINSTELLFKFYDVYLKLTRKENVEPFDLFAKWAQVIIQDFNEIDRYLIPQQNIFDYLKAIKNIEQDHWSTSEEKTKLISNYLTFWNKLSEYYTLLSETLRNNGVGYQGLIYREAVENLEAYMLLNSKSHYVFLGFNALNTAESSIIQELLENDLASIYWDVDEAFINTKRHNAGLFINDHKNTWNYYKNNSMKWISKNYSSPKNISVYGVPKQIGQVKFIGSLLDKIASNNPSFNSTAIVLGNEDLLLPMVNSLPNSVKNVNITMGFPLKEIPLASLFDKLFQIHKNTNGSFYFKDVIAIISHPFIKPLLMNGADLASQLIETITKENIVYTSKALLKSLIEEEVVLIDLLFDDYKQDPHKLLENCSILILEIKNHLNEDKSNNILELEYLFRFNTLFNELTNFNNQYKHITNIGALYGVYKELLSSETLDFQGEPLQGLQIMGVLESRVLDFETVIISSVNEGVLPSGKSMNSFIPFDVKLENKLPTYKEKDAIYAYHFFRLLQRAKNVYIIYNTEVDALKGGEKSRFIQQLEVENIHEITHHIVTTKVNNSRATLRQITKTAGVVNRLKSIGEKGFSPSSLSTYIRNPIDFYNQKVLGIKEFEDVEETVAANTLGTIVHNTLEDFYKPYVGEYLTVDILNKMKISIDETVAFHFKNEYKQGDITKGKNLIIYQVAKRYVLNFINQEIEELNNENTIKILAIEVENKVEIIIPELNSPIYLTGKVDRIDEYNGLTRIIDYKTGRVEKNKIEIIHWEDITTDYDKYSKSFQILCYALMLDKKGALNFPLQAGIISFKNLSSGFLKFAKKDPQNSRIKDNTISIETLMAFETELKKLILEIYNQKLDFIEKEIL